MLDNISFIVNKDDKIAFVGSNELATTTLFNILTVQILLSLLFSVCQIPPPQLRPSFQYLPSTGVLSINLSERIFIVLIAIATLSCA